MSIPTLRVYDAETNTLIPYGNVSLTMLFNNTTTQLIPSFPVLPWNQTITLNVSVTGYNPRGLELTSTINALSVYLKPSNATLTPISNATIPSTTVSSGLANLSEELNLEFEEALGDYFSTRLGLGIAVAVAIGLAIMSLVYHRNTFTTLTVFGVAITYLAYYVNAPWGLAWAPIVMWVAYGLWRMVGKGGE